LSAIRQVEAPEPAGRFGKKIRVLASHEIAARRYNRFMATVDADPEAEYGQGTRNK
jgi:hypothetical protein